LLARCMTSYEYVHDWELTTTASQKDEEHVGANTSYDIKNSYENYIVGCYLCKYIVCVLCE